MAASVAALASSPFGNMCNRWAKNETRESSSMRGVPIFAIGEEKRAHKAIKF